MHLRTHCHNCGKCYNEEKYDNFKYFIFEIRFIMFLSLCLLGASILTAPMLGLNLLIAIVLTTVPLFYRYSDNLFSNKIDKQPIHQKAPYKRKRYI